MSVNASDDGFDYVISVRAAEGDHFGDRVGPTGFLKVPASGQSPSPKDAIGKDAWRRTVIALAGRRQDATGVTRGDVLTFVHGVNNSAATVLLRHRRLKADLARFGYRGAVISFDWPAGSVALAYWDDREKAKQTAFGLVRDCIEVLARMQAGTGCDINVHLLAHSTGAYVVREAFDDADDRAAIAAVNWTASQVALIGGDVSADSLGGNNAGSASLYRHCVRLTNYSSTFDEALQLSNAKRFGLAARVGRVGLPAGAPRTAVNVDCSEYYQLAGKSHPPTAPGEITSHSWYIGDPVFSEDLAHTLNGDLDRGAIGTREPLPTGQFKLVGPRAAVATVPGTPAPTRSA